MLSVTLLWYIITLLDYAIKVCMIIRFSLVPYVNSVIIITHSLLPDMYNYSDRYYIYSITWKLVYLKAPQKKVIYHTCILTVFQLLTKLPTSNLYQNFQLHVCTYSVYNSESSYVNFLN